MTLSILLTFFSSLIAIPDTSIHASIGAQAIVSDAGVTPFWMRSLQYGSVPMENPGLVLRAWNGKGYNFKKKYDWKYEVEATGWTGIQNDIWLTQAYVSGRWRKWELWAGRRKEVYGLGDTTMTSGFYAWSGNAMPIPKVQLGTRDFLNFAKGWLGIHMTYSHGWLDNLGPLKNEMLHQKSFYGRLGKQNSLLNLFGGLNHQVTWGGESKIKTGSWEDYYPSSLNAYFYVITLLKDRTIVPEDKNTSWVDANNQYGNHLGSIDLAVKLQPKWGTILLYKQTAYETGRVFSLVTADDGITGFSVKRNKNNLINNITFEYLYTANQGLYRSSLAKFLQMKDPHFPEQESYFNSNHRGWVYNNKGIGTPLIVVDSETRNGGGPNFSSNAVKAFYLSISGILPYKIKYIIKRSQSLHGGILMGDNYPYSRYVYFVNQRSINIHLERQFHNHLNFSLDFGQDKGRHLLNTNAIIIGINYKIF
jgi:hypothetical protein